MLKKFLKNDKGLTLVELLAVIVILGIIAAIAVPSIGNIIEKSRADAVKAEGVQVLNAAKLYMTAEGPIADGTTLASSNLTEYLTENGGVTWDTAFTVSPDLKLNGVATKGNVTITFTDATVSKINTYEYSDSDKTID
ncbi:prepilin-type N-terminal cleavage/methylation domain-containing protein [Rossellomorea aquimaris]|uniref:type IV pilin protein n=1 Tax=Rossellomorea aquimaris TaxID=189382 RepID=UPI001CD42941|nr:prepilin-type N-terminal cleavage/methylation domain-containing protein [Rossellomorea aquimaris]MCA1056323.1 prepilin-type N-terminal cleavage/methylation domain-containing protein [Rossellomorea aquimaris]